MARVEASGKSEREDEGRLVGGVGRRGSKGQTRRTRRKRDFRGGRAEGRRRGGGRPVQRREWGLSTGPLDIYLDEAKAASQQGFNVLPSPPLQMPIFLLRRSPLVSSTSCAPFAER